MHLSLIIHALTCFVQLKIMQQKNMKPSDLTLAALSVSCSRSLQLDLAEIFLDQVSKKSNDVNLFNEFLRACDAVVSVPSKAFVT